MNFKVGKTNIYIEPVLFIVALLTIFVIPMRNYFKNYAFCFLFVMFHEFSHIFVASILGVECTRINIRLCGMNAEFDFSSRISLKWLYIAFAGPVSNFLLSILFSRIEMVRDINLALGIVNLLPVAPLDGYYIFKTILEFFFAKNRVKKILKMFSFCVLTLIVLIGIYLAITIKNPTILIFITYVVILRNAAEI